MTDFLLFSPDRINKFRETNARHIELANLLLGLEWEFCCLVARCENVNPFLTVNTQTVHEYHREALLLSMNTRAHVSMAVMRLATELARDIFRICENQALVSLWLDRSKEAKRKRREVFRFDEKNSSELHLMQLYDLFSSFGVHGHLQFTAPVAETLSADGKSFVRLRGDERFSADLFLLISKGIYLYCLIVLGKFEPIFRCQNLELRAEIGSYGRGFSSRAEPFEQYVRTS